MHDPDPFVIVPAGPENVEDALCAILRIPRLCTRPGLLLTVACLSAPVRRLTEENADPDATPPVIHARADTTVATAASLVRAGAALV